MVERMGRGFVLFSTGARRILTKPPIRPIEHHEVLASAPSRRSPGDRDLSTHGNSLLARIYPRRASYKDYLCQLTSR